MRLKLKEREKRSTNAFSKKKKKKIHFDHVRYLSRNLRHVAGYCSFCYRVTCKLRLIASRRSLFVLMSCSRNQSQAPSKND